MKSFRPHPNRIVLLAAVLFLLALASACKRATLVQHQYMYVSAPETSLRDRVATMYNKIGTVHNGDRLEVLEKQRRFLRVRTDSGQEGWIEERSLVSQEVYDAFQKLVQDSTGQPVQAHGTTRAELNMHDTPSREAEHLYQLKDGEKVDILKRATAPKVPPKAPTATQTGKSNAAQSIAQTTPVANPANQTPAARPASATQNPPPPPAKPGQRAPPRPREKRPSLPSR